MSVRLVGARVLTPEGWAETSVSLERDAICAVGDDACPTDQEIRLDGLRLIPGLIDLHGDAIEKEIEPRPGVFLPLPVALHAMDRRYAASGVTTAYHAVSFATGEFGVRSPTRAAELARAIAAFDQTSLVRHRVHVRYEVTDIESEAGVADLLDDGVASLLSFMDHTPGQGQFRSVADYAAYVGQRNQFSANEVTDLLARKATHASSAHERMARLADRAGRHAVPIASHDDDSSARVALMRGLGAVISEFPMTLDTAKTAHRSGLRVCVGAPNALRGASQGGGMSARDAIAESVVTALVSDYAPQTLLPAASKMDAASGSGAKFSLVTRGPADAVGAEHLGRVRVGDQADLVAFVGDGEAARCVAVWIQGVLVWRSVDVHHVTPPPKPHFDRA